ncbi:MAG: hypothetical protein ACREIV_13755, partial [Planctomycetaceae bacterium]
MMKYLRIVAAALVPALAPAMPGQAAPWLAPGDAGLRHDLELLADAGLVHAPLTAWPVSWPEVARDVASIEPDASRPAWLVAALERVQSGARAARRTGSFEWNARLSASKQPMT